MPAPEPPYVEALVVRCARPASARPGDRAIVHADGTIEGFVGGSCADETVRLHALHALETGEPVLVRIVPGEVDGRDEEGAVVVANPCLSGGALEVFLEPHLPAPLVRVVGDSPVARAVAQLAPGVGFEVVEEGEPFAVVVASLGHDDERALSDALASGASYVGLVASRRRGAAVLAALGAGAERVHTPAGLDIGARTPAEIALSILAEVIAERRRSVIAPTPVEHHAGHACHS